MLLRLRKVMVHENFMAHDARFFQTGVGASSLFIDMIGRPLTPVSVAGVRRRGRRRGRLKVISIA